MSDSKSTTPTVRYVEIKPGYRVGDDGSVESCWTRKKLPGYRTGFTHVMTDRWHRLKPWSDRNGYQRVDLGSRHSDCRFVYHLVLEAFVGPRPPGLECRHLDGNPANNRVENLVWGTHEENGQDTVRHGTSCKGEKQHSAVLTEANVLEALALRAAGESIGSIARRLGVAHCTISGIFHGRTWRHVTDVAGLPPARENWGIPKGEGCHRAVLTDDDVLVVLQKHRAGESTRAIARQLGVGHNAIRSILVGRTWRHVTGMTPSGPDCSTS